MTIKEIYEKLLSARRPIDFFGKCSDENILKKIYRSYTKMVHPDLAKNNEKYIANEAFSILNNLYHQGLNEIEQGTYEIFDPIKVYKNASPLFEIDLGDKVYTFYENLYEGEVGTIYRGTSDTDLVYLKMATNPSDNDLIDNEFEVLSSVRHQSLPYVEEKIQVNDSSAIIMREVKGITMNDLMEQYPSGVPAIHVMWMMERLLGVVGYLHSNLVVHGNIKPENIIINKDNHNVSLVGFSFSIPEANKPGARYKIINDFYTAPEVTSTSTVQPSSDIYSIGKVAIKLLGGDVESNGMPISVDSRVRSFIRRMVEKSVSSRPNDAWKLWTELIKLRTEVFGNKRFIKLD